MLKSRSQFAGLLILMLASLAAPVPARADAAADFLAGAAAYRERKYDLCVGLYTSVIRSGEMKGEDLAAAQFNRALCYEALGEKTKAYDDFGTAGLIWPADPDAPSNLVRLGVELRRYPEATAALATLFDRFPETVTAHKWEVVQIARVLELKGEWQQADDLLARYAKLDSEDSPINLSRARAAASLGRTQEALDLILNIDNQYTFIITRADKGFAKLWGDPAFLAATDLPTFFARQLARSEQDMRTSPDKLTSIGLRMDALRNTGRYQEAIQLGERTVADFSRFTDRAHMAVWIYNDLARFNAMTGDFAAAERAYRTGVERLGDSDSTLVNILLNGGDFLAQKAGKYREALLFADRAEKAGASSYGRMYGNFIRAAAYWGLKQQADLDRIVAEMEKTVSENPTAAIDVYLLLGRRDDAAKLVASQLADPRRVDATLISLQRYTKVGRPLGDAEKVILDGWDALRAHPLVLAALGPVGRVTTIAAAGSF